MEKVSKILILLGYLICWACERDFMTVIPSTTLSITLKNESNTLLDKADVYLFDNASSFTQTTAQGIPTGFVQTVKSVQGTAVFDKLSAEVNYYIFAVYNDGSLFPGGLVRLDNSAENFALKNTLAPGSITSLTIILKPVDGVITFWTSSTNQPVLPIDIYLNSQLVGSLTQSSAVIPTAFGPGSFSLAVRKGTQLVEGKSTSSCVWTNTVSVASGKQTVYQLSDCGVGTLAFYVNNTNVSKLPITLRLNANDVLPSITAATGLGLVACTSPNVIAVSRVPGTYTYEAISISGNCVWTGIVSLTANTCTPLLLTTCP